MCHAGLCRDDSIWHRFRNGYVFIGEHTARAVLDAGIKCNFSVGLTCFEDKDLHQLPIYQENLFCLKIIITPMTGN